MGTDNELMLDVGQANELKLAARRAKATNADLKALSEGEMFARILPVLRGLGEVVVKKHLIDLDTDPFVPEKWSFEYHKKDGQFEWDPAKVKLHLSPNQQDGKVIAGNNLRKELKHEFVLNANLLDYLLANQNLIPQEWKGKVVFFWGTIYRDSDGNLYVRCLYWDGSQWSWRFLWLVHGWVSNYPAAVRTS